MANKQWNPKLIYLHSKDFLREAYDFNYKPYFADLEAYIEGRPLEFGYGNVMEALRGLSFWHEKEFVVRANEGDKDSARLLSLSFEYDYLRDVVTHGYCLTLKTIGFGSSLHDFVSHVAKGISIGSWNEAEHLGKQILKNIDREGWFSSTYGTKLAPFVLALFCDWQKLPAPEKELFDPLPDFYEAIVADWKTEDFEELEGALLAACDFHIERSREHTSRELFEFNWEFYRVYPAEILAILKLREMLGLTNSAIEHPLMQLPTARLVDREIVRDELLEKVKEKARLELNLGRQI